MEDPLDFQKHGTGENPDRFCKKEPFGALEMSSVGGLIQANDHHDHQSRDREIYR